MIAEDRFATWLATDFVNIGSFPGVGTKLGRKTENSKYDYPINTDPDMIIYELEEDINNKFAKPANLPKENQEFGLYTVSGWGSMNKARDWSDVLRSVELADLGSPDSCNLRLGRPWFTPSKYICGENQKKYRAWTVWW